MGRYSKLVGALAGNIIAILLAWMAVQFPGIAECGPASAADLAEVCSVLGFSQAQITGALMLGVNAVFVYAFPPNDPPA